MQIGASEYKAAMAGWIARAVAVSSTHKMDEHYTGEESRIVQAAQNLGAPAGMVQEIKAAIAASSTIGQPELSGEGAAFAAFAKQTSATSAFMAMFAADAFQRIPFQTRLLSIANDITAASHGEGEPIPLDIPSWDKVVLEEEAASVIVAFSDEVLRNISRGGQGFINDALRRAIGKVADTRLIEELTHTGTPTYAAASADDDATVTAFSSAIKHVRTTVFSNVVWIASVTALNSLNDKLNHDPRLDPAGGRLFGLPVYMTDALPAGMLVCVDGWKIAANAAGLAFSGSRAAAIQMRDDPVTGATSLVSLFQTNSAATKATLSFGLKRLDDTAAAFVELT